jgi:putative FmdB family regulatory protein
MNDETGVRIGFSIVDHSSFIVIPMPTYEYRCESCGHRFEKFQSIKAAPLKACPACGKNTAKRLISAGGGIIFKGSGFYITDYRDASYKEKAKADSGAAKPAEGTGTAAAGSGDSKPAADAPKSETKQPPKSESKPAPKTEPKPPAKSEK